MFRYGACTKRSTLIGVEADIDFETLYEDKGHDRDESPLNYLRVNDNDDNNNDLWDCKEQFLETHSDDVKPVYLHVAPTCTADDRQVTLTWSRQSGEQGNAVTELRVWADRSERRESSMMPTVCRRTGVAATILLASGLRPLAPAVPALRPTRQLPPLS